MGQDFFLIAVQRGRLGLPPALPLSQANKRRGTAPIEPGKRGAAGGGGGGRRAERRDGRREGGLEGWVQVPLDSRREEIQAARELTSTSLRSSRTTTPHHKTRCVPGNDSIYAPHLTLCIISVRVECAAVYQRVCSFYAPSQDAAGSQQLDSCSSEKSLFLISADPTPALATSAPLRFRSPSPLGPRVFRRTPLNSGGFVSKPRRIPAGIGSERTGRRKRAKGSRILNHTLHAIQPDVQTESCGATQLTFFSH